MRSSQWLLATQKETPSDAELPSHQLMLRAGMIRKLGSGLYTWLPMGIKVLRHVERIVREEMNRIGAMEIFMPAIQPAELWQETGRWETFGGQLLTMKDSNEREYCFGPTHEEVVTDLMRNELRSYKQLPVTVYQIQTKFRDEIRPRFGVMRAREFLMKDAYSFHTTTESLQQTYDAMYQAYSRIFERLGLQYRAVEADTGAIGGAVSHEFQVLADAGEDIIFHSDTSQYAANVEQATSFIPTGPGDLLPGTETITWVKGRNHPAVALILRSDDVLNPIKSAKHPLVHSPLEIISTPNVIDTNTPVIIDYHAQHLASLPSTILWDLRTVKEGDKSPDGRGTLRACRGIEVGHIFQLGDTYARAMGASVLNESGTLQPMLMGCYGIGISRIIAAAIEQHHDDRGIIWPPTMAPFQLVLIPINAHRSDTVRETAEKLYQECLALGVDVLLDDRNDRPGVLFADNDLIGIPHRIIISDRHLENNCVEYKSRTDTEGKTLLLSDISAFLLAIQESHALVQH